MGLEEQLYIKRFYVTENCERMIPLGNDFGDVNTEPVSKNEYGPFIETEVQNQLALLRAERLKNGWTEYNKNSQDLFKKGKPDLCISYSVQEKFIPYSNE
jgi:hypothetical protein